MGDCEEIRLIKNKIEHMLRRITITFCVVVFSATLFAQKNKNLTFPDSIAAAGIIKGLKITVHVYYGIRL